MAQYEEEKFNIDRAVREHGPAVISKCRGYIIFEDGSTRQQMAGAHLKLPDTRPYQRQRMIVMFYERRLEIAIEEFTHLKESLMMTTSSNIAHRGGYTAPPPSEEELEKLKALRRKVANRRIELKRAEEELEPLKPYCLRKQKEADDRNKELNTDFYSRLKSIDI